MHHTDTPAAAAQVEIRPGIVRVTPRVHYFPGNAPAAPAPASDPDRFPCSGAELAEWDAEAPADPLDLDEIPAEDRLWWAEQDEELRMREAEIDRIRDAELDAEVYASASSLPRIASGPMTLARELAFPMALPGDPLHGVTAAEWKAVEPIYQRSLDQLRWQTAGLCRAMRA